MGNYLNPGNEKFRRMIQSEIYVDKTGMIKYTNSVLDTAQNYVCVSRPRRFGKSMAANMLTAYYSRGCNSKELFGKFEIAKDKDFEKYLNQYNTIFLNMQEFLSRSHNVEELIDRVKKLVIRDLKMEYPEVDYFDDTDLIECMQDIYAQMQCPFIVIIDEWDCIFREYKQSGHRLSGQPGSVPVRPAELHVIRFRHAGTVPGSDQRALRHRAGAPAASGSAACRYSLAV